MGGDEAGGELRRRDVLRRLTAAGALLTPVAAQGKPHRKTSARSGIGPTSLVAQLSPDGTLQPVMDGSRTLAVAQDEPRHPASITKLMTALVTWETIAADRTAMERERPRMEALTGTARARYVEEFARDNDIRFPHGLETPIRMSAYAAQPTFNISGYRAGTMMPAATAIELMLTRSFNDVAIAIAEHVGGAGRDPSVDASRAAEQRFVALMNARADRAGMSNTRFGTPNGQDRSGEHPAQNVTTAADIARLLGQFAPYAGKRDTLAVLAPENTVFQRTFYGNMENQVLDRNLSTARDGVLVPIISKSGLNTAGRYCEAMLVQGKGTDLYAVVMLHEDSEAALEGRRASLLGRLDRVVNGPAAAHRPVKSFRPG